MVMCSTFKWLVVIVSKPKRDLIETGIAPLSKKMAVKCLATAMPNTSDTSWANGKKNLRSGFVSLL